jgi:ATP-dependent Lon protease
MQSRLVPLFPLEAVILPRLPLPLHIFEERYKEMVGEAIRAGSEFGIVLARAEGIVNSGCTVTVEQVVRTYEDGRMDILTRGQRRFEILSLNDEKPYLRGEVEFFDDEDSAPLTPEVREKALAQFRTLREVTERPGEEPAPDDPQPSFFFAQFIPDLDFLQTLLASRSENERLKQISAFLAGFVPKQRLAMRMKQVAPLNGHGLHPPGL